METTLQRTLKEWRTHLEISQLEMADKLEVSPSTYNIWENNPEELRVKVVIRISEIFNVPVEDIVFYNKKSNFRYSLKGEYIVKGVET